MSFLHTLSHDFKAVTIQERARVQERGGGESAGDENGGGKEGKKSARFGDYIWERTSGVAAGSQN